MWWNNALIVTSKMQLAHWCAVMWQNNVSIVNACNPYKEVDLAVTWMLHALWIVFSFCIYQILVIKLTQVSNVHSIYSTVLIQLFTVYK